MNIRKKISLFFIVLLALCIIIGCQFSQVIMASKNEFFLVYPPDGYQTTAQSIFFLGVASTGDPVYINEQTIPKTKNGYFAAKFSLTIGQNTFKVTNQGQEKTLTVVRDSNVPELPQDASFLANSLTPQTNIERNSGELICFSAIAPEEATVTAKVGKQVIPLFSQSNIKQLSANSYVLVDSSAPPPVDSFSGHYKGCSIFNENEIPTPLEVLYELTYQGTKITQNSPGKIKIISQKSPEVVAITVDSAITRTGPSTDYSRLTPLPKGTLATVTGKEGDWLRLDYGAWVKAQETTIVKNAAPVHSLIRGIYLRKTPGVTEILFPLEVPVPFTIQQSDNLFILHLYNTTAQTDIIRSDYDSFLKRIDWKQTSPNNVEYIFRLTAKQQWGYSLRYEGTTLILALRHPPIDVDQNNSLKGITILLDPGHGGKDSGAFGPNGYAEKEATLIIARFLQQELMQLGATVQLTRSSDTYISLEDRVKLIEQIQPTVSISLHYNSLPDGGDPVKIMGVSSYWYHTQAEDLASFLENYIVHQLKRNSYGVYWDNLALTRPTIAPSILLELGFMINPEEFEWILDQGEQRKLAHTIAHGIQEWFEQD